MRDYKRTACILAGVLALSACAGCALENESVLSEKETEAGSGEEENNEKQSESVVQKADVQDINDVHLRDKDSLYENDDDSSVVTMYLTVSRGNSSENTDHSWEDINEYSVYDYEYMGVDRYQVAGLLQVGDESGPTEGELGYGESVPNATVQIRGQSSSKGAQKNYKIELKKNKGTWRGQRTINLNKHMSEGMRFRNKLAYDLIKGIPQMIGLRTQFVHLYVKDMTDDDAEGQFEDYGLYTQVEQLNKTGLKNHGLDSNGQLYKVNFFEFFRQEDVIKEQEEEGYDQKAFEELLEIKGSSDHSKLIGMLDALNDYSISIDTVLDQYFDRENLTYWMAFHILIGNIDTQSRNVFLYSPLNSEKWYFISWDNDGSFMRTEDLVKSQRSDTGWETGVSNYWGNILFQRCLKSEKFRGELDRAILDLKEYLSEERIGNMIQNYKNVVKPFVYEMPDAMYAPLTSEQYEEVADGIPKEVEQNYQSYLESLEKPMPFYIGVPEMEDGQLEIEWDPAYDFDAEDITYSVEVAKDYLFQDLIYQKDGILIPEMEMEAPAAGQYFVRVKATNESGKEQMAFDYYITDDGKQYGIKCFYITEDGQIEEDIYEE
nr:CotH kinase family protein [uncultured Blautia sp.]